MANTSRKDSKGRKLREGETERKDGRYVYRYTEKRTGRRQSIYARDLAELREKEKAVNLDIYNHIKPDSMSKQLTVNDLFERYLDIKEISDSTKVSYRSAWDNHVRAGIGQYKVVQLFPSDIKKFYAGLSQKGYAHGMIKVIHNVLHPVLEMAVEDDIIHKNPSKGTLGDYGRAREEKKALTIPQQNRLMEFLKSDSMYGIYHPMLTVMLETGIRCGELSGLTWNDVDMDKKEISINHQLIYKDFGDGLKLHANKPKTSAGIRRIPMTENVYKAFDDQRKLNALLGRDKNAYEVDGYTDFVFVTRNGRPLLMNSVNKILTNIVKAINSVEESAQEEPFPNISAHTMRHTFCTRMAENNCNIKALQYIMGHANINITMQVYTHIADMTQIEKEMSRINMLAANF